MAIEAITTLVENARGTYENLNEREKKLVLIMGAVFSVMLIGLPLFFAYDAISSVREENAEIELLIRDIHRAADRLAEEEARRKATERLFDNPAGPLATFLETQAKKVGYTRAPSLDNEPDKVEGGYVRSHVRATFTGIKLGAFMKMLESIKRSGHPMAIERIEIQHYSGGDQYTVEVGLVAFALENRAGNSAEEDDEKEKAGPDAP